MPRAAWSDRSSDVVPPFPPLAAPCTPPTPVGFCSLMSAASRRLTVPEDKETGGSFAVGQEAPRKPPPGTTDWFSSLQGGAGALHPPPRHLHWGPLTSAHAPPHGPAPGSTTSRKGRGREPSHSEAHVSSCLSHCHGNCSSFTSLASYGPGARGGNAPGREGIHSFLPEAP